MDHTVSVTTICILVVKSVIQRVQVLFVIVIIILVEVRVYLKEVEIRIVQTITNVKVIVARLVGRVILVISDYLHYILPK